MLFSKKDTKELLKMANFVNSLKKGQFFKIFESKVFLQNLGVIWILRDVYMYQASKGLDFIRPDICYCYLIFSLKKLVKLLERFLDK